MNKINMWLSILNVLAWVGLFIASLVINDANYRLMFTISSAAVAVFSACELFIWRNNNDRKIERPDD